MSDAFVAAVARGLEALDPPGRLLVAVSGGADSVALLDALAKARSRRALRSIGLVVGHVDHQLRPDSGVDARLVLAHAERLSLPFELAVVAVSAAGVGLEQAAREARYEALERMATGAGCGAVVTAHTATDQAETVLWRLARGAGTHGLAAMASRRPLGRIALLRPLLGIRREEARAYCDRMGLRFHDDPTNVDDRPRARLRAEVLPVLERLAPGATDRIAAAALRLREDDAFLEGLVRATSDVAALRSLDVPLRRRALLRWVEEACGTRRRVAASHLSALDRLVVSGRGEVDMPALKGERFVVVLRDGHLTLERRARG